jgi:transcriptional regulator with XRE-family HTH domain
MRPDDVFGAWLRQRRKTLDVTQAELAHQVGCALVTVKKLETGSRRASKQIAERLAAVDLAPLDEGK